VTTFDDMDAGTDTVTERDPRRLVLAAVGALLLGGLLWFLVVSPLMGGGAQELTVVNAATTADDTVAEADEPDEAEVVVEDLPLVTYEVFLDRDPFDPVVPEPVSTTETVAGDGEATDGTGDGAATGDGSETPTDPNGETDPVGTPPPAAGTPPASPPAQGVGSCVADGDDLVCNGRVVSLIEIRTGDDGELLAVVQVDTTIYEVGIGDAFAGSFRVHSISETEVLIQYGDDVDRFEVGDRVLK
jgi:hypothetical protein